MEITLEVRERFVRSKPYYRMNIPLELSNRLYLKKGDRLRLKILDIARSETSDMEVSKRQG